MKTPEEATTLISSLWEYHPPDAVRAMRERDAEIRRDTIEKAKELLRRAASDEGDSPRDTLTQYLSGYRDGRQSCSARVLAALDALLQEDPSPDTGKPSEDLCDKLIAEAKRAIKEMPNEGFLRRMNYSVPALGVSGVLKTLDRVLRDWKRLGRDVKGVPK